MPAFAATATPLPPPTLTSAPHSPPAAALPGAWRQAYARLVARVSLYPADHPHAGAYRARQLDAVMRLFPLTALVNVLIGLLVAHVFWKPDTRTQVLVWYVVVVLLQANGLPGWWQQYTGRLRRTVSRRGLRRVMLHSLVIGLMWGAMPVMLAPAASDAERVLIWVITAAMVGGGSFTLCTLPGSATVFLLTTITGSSLSLALSDYPLRIEGALLNVGYTLVSVASAWITARAFCRQLLAESQVEQQRQVIGRLLEDYAESARDVLWETDAQLQLRQVTPRLAALFGLPPEQMEGVSLTQALQNLLGAPGRDTEQAIQALRDSMAREMPFREHLLPLQVLGEAQWWTVSGKPLLDAAGHCVGWRGVATDTTAAHHAKQQLALLAQSDALTGLANRAGFHAAAGAALTGAGAEQRQRALVWLNIDHFKDTNESLGLAAGDAVLVAVGQRLDRCALRSEVAARLGGDEFALLLEADDVLQVDQRLRKLFDSVANACTHQGAPIAVRLSAGVALWPTDGNDLENLMHHAGLALRDAKRGGRGNWRWFAPQMGADSRRRLGIEQALRDAQDNGELSLAYQPQVTLDTQTVKGFEALLRWQHPELGTVSPAEFVPIAEANGLIERIGEWVLFEACRQAMQWPASVAVSVNVSPVQAMLPSFPHTVQRALAETGLPPARLELEITESIFIQDSAVTLNTLSTLHTLGVRIALDDFGTGYSSLAYLRRFPFDTLKIDRAFVRDLLTRRDARAIVDTILELASTLKMSTVAEGVEEVAQLRALQQQGCHLVQGYLVAKPMPAAAAAEFIQRKARRPAPARPRQRLAEEAALV